MGGVNQCLFRSFLGHFVYPGRGVRHQRITARPPFWRQTLAPNCRSLEQSLAHSRVLAALRSILLGWPKSSGVTKHPMVAIFLRDHGGRASPPQTLHATTARKSPAQPPHTTTQQSANNTSPARTVNADRTLPWSLGSSPTSPALGARVWHKVWGKSMDFSSLDQSLSFLYEISRIPLPGLDRSAVPRRG